jgi:FlaA1/EpsC-like NDP-sugar epimerase
VRGGYGERALIVGAGEGGQIVNWLLKRGPLRQAFSVVGMVDDDPAKQGMCVDGCTVLGGGRDLPELAREHDVGVILFTIANISEAARMSLLQFCNLPGVRVVFLNDVLSAIQVRLSGKEKQTG